VKRKKFKAEVLSGHKEQAVEVPFDPAKEWGVAAQPRLAAATPEPTPAPTPTNRQADRADDPADPNENLFHM